MCAHPTTEAGICYRDDEPGDSPGDSGEVDEEQEDVLGGGVEAQESETTEGPGEDDGDVWDAGAVGRSEDARGVALGGEGMESARGEEDVGVGCGERGGEDGGVDDGG